MSIAPLEPYTAPLAPSSSTAPLESRGFYSSSRLLEASTAPLEPSTAPPPIYPACTSLQDLAIFKTGAGSPPPIHPALPLPG